jgi:hypothetical protein
MSPPAATLSHLVESLKDNAWIALIVVVIGAAFRDSLKALATKVINSLGSLIYGRLAGSRFIRRRAIAKYRKGLSAATEKIPVPFRPNRPLVLRDIYISLRASAVGTSEPQDVWDALAQHGRLVVTGPPGAGKSMLMRHLAADDEHVTKPHAIRNRVPVLVELHRLGRPASNGGVLIEDYVVDAFNRHGFPHAEKFLKTAIEKGWLLILLDGFDEVPSADRSSVASRIRDFLEEEAGCAAVITSRTAVYRGEFDAVTGSRVELEPFEDQQIQNFLEPWGEDMPPEKSPAQLMASLREQPQLLAAARNPLLLTIITHLYSDIETYVLPHSRAQFYRQASNILLEQWQGHLGNNDFDGTEKSNVLSNLALHMQETATKGELDRRTISREDAIALTTQLMPNIGRDPSHVTPILREIVERSGLLLLIDDGTRYAFAHLTFQEYFSAAALTNRTEEMLEGFERDPDTWREVCVLWCGLVADSTEMIARIEAIDPLVALACVAEARQVDAAVAERILDPMVAKVIAGNAGEELERRLGAVAADIRPRGSAVLDALVGGLSASRTTKARLAIANALSASNRPAAAAAIAARLEDDPDLAPSVIRLGDLAVPRLKQAGLEGGPPLICECLASIGTPDAGEALAQITLRADPLSAIPAAWGLASVIQNPLVERRLSTFAKSLRFPPRSELDWIWRPFAGPDQDALCSLVGHAASLIIATGDAAAAIATPDPRISVALCAKDPNPLNQQIPSSVDGEALLDVANAVAETGFAFNDAGQVEGFRPAPVVSRRTTGAILDGGLTYGELLGAAYSSVLTEIRNTKGWSPTDEAAIWDGLQPVINEALRCIDASPAWGLLVAGLPEHMRGTVLVASSGNAKVDGSTWDSVCDSRPFYFGRSRWYAAIVGIMLAASVGAEIEGVRIMLDDLGSRQSILALVAVVFIPLTWLWMWLDSEPSSSAGQIDPDSLLEGVFGIFVAPYEAVDDIRIGIFGWDNAARFLTVGFLPGIIWFALSGLGDIIGSAAALIVLASLIALCVALWAYGSTAGQRKFMPLRGFFAPGSLMMRPPPYHR